MLSNSGSCRFWVHLLSKSGCQGSVRFISFTQHRRNSANQEVSISAIQVRQDLISASKHLSVSAMSNLGRSGREVRNSASKRLSIQASQRVEQEMLDRALYSSLRSSKDAYQITK